MSISEVVSWLAPAASGLLGAWLGARVVSSQAKLSEMVWIEGRVQQLNAGRRCALDVLFDLRMLGQSWLMHDDAAVGEAVGRMQFWRERIKNITHFQEAVAVVVQDVYWADGERKSVLECSNALSRSLIRLVHAVDCFAPTGPEQSFILRFRNNGALQRCEISTSDHSLDLRGSIEMRSLEKRVQHLRIAIHSCLGCIEMHENNLNGMYNTRAISVFGYAPQQQWRRKLWRNIPRPFSKLHGKFKR
ncbi:hypothetical protein [Acuticoccus yangtzensis]|uniref:hypothetical protein n=1 Tax=Acuticoccus yangtzensis TaxID=1443441 RepID=UPI000A4BBA6A|nr:hypothetical protein [Acuticoccus yangtzensis]